MEAVASRTISLLTIDLKTRKLIGISREIMEESQNSLNFSTKMLARRSNAMWDILLDTVEETKILAGRILT